MGTKTICAGNCGGSRVTLAAALAGLPAEVSTALRTQVDQHQADAAAGTGSRLTCLGDDKKPPANCIDRKDRGDVPWFDPSAPGCTDLRDTQLAATFSRGKCTFTLSACGRVVLRNSEFDVTNAAGCRPEFARDLMIERYGIATLPKKVCCDIFQEAAGAGGCNPEVDADCDGKPNDKDQFLEIQDPNYAPYPGASDKVFNPADFDPKPRGVEWDELMPNEPCKECKWLAASGKLICSPDKNKQIPESRKRDHEYRVTWKCPTSGVQRVVTKRVPARFPCTPPKRPPTPTPVPPAFRP